MPSRANVAISTLDSARISRHIPALTGLRAVAAYLVFLHHYNPASPGTFAHRLFAQGYIGVSLFFVLSGFLIFHRYADTYFAQINWSWWRYGQNRFARIFPLYALLLFVTVSVNAALGRPIRLPILGLNLTLLKGFFEEYKFSGIAQSWSLTVEVCFYLLAPFLFIDLRRWGVVRLTAGLLGIGLLLWATVRQLTWHGEFTRGLFGSLPFMLFYTFFGRAFEFVVGMWLAHRWRQIQRPRYRFATSSGLVVLSVCVVWQASVTMLTSNPTILLWSEVVVYNWVMPVGIGVFFLGLLREKSIIRSALSLPVLQALGKSSYAFYLIHIGVIADGLQKIGVTNKWLLFGALVLVAHCLFVFIENPLNRRLKLVVNPSIP